MTGVQTCALPILSRHPGDPLSEVNLGTVVDKRHQEAQARRFCAGECAELLNDQSLVLLDEYQTESHALLLFSERLILLRFAYMHYELSTIS